MIHVRPAARPLNAARGFTLIETVIVLGVIALVVGAIWVVAGATTENAKQYSFTQQLQQTVNNARQVYQRINAFTVASGTDVTQTLDRQGVFPREMRYSQPASDSAATGILNHQWASSSAGSVTVLTRGTQTFGIRYASIPKKACINLAVKLSGADTGLDTLVIGSNVYTAASLPLTTITANTACSSSNTMEWRFTLRAQ